MNAGIFRERSIDVIEWWRHPAHPWGQPAWRSGGGERLAWPEGWRTGRPHFRTQGLAGDRGAWYVDQQSGRCSHP